MQWKKNVATEKSDAFTNVHNSKDNISKEFLCFHLFPYILIWFNFFGEVDAPFLLFFSHRCFLLLLPLGATLFILIWQICHYLMMLHIFRMFLCSLAWISILFFIPHHPCLFPQLIHLCWSFFIQLSFLFMFEYPAILSFVKNNANTRTWKKS